AILSVPIRRYGRSSFLNYIQHITKGRPWFAYRPHLVHITGHGELDANGIGRFAFEDERGGTDSQPVAEIINQVFRGSAVRCLFLNACQTGKAAAAGLSEQLVKAGV